MNIWVALDVGRRWFVNMWTMVSGIKDKLRLWSPVILDNAISVSEPLKPHLSPSASCCVCVTTSHYSRARVGRTKSSVWFVAPNTIKGFHFSNFLTRSLGYQHCNRSGNSKHISKSYGENEGILHCVCPFPTQPSDLSASNS